MPFAFKACVLVATLVLPARATASEYDGKWAFENNCSAASGVRRIGPFTLRLPAIIEDGKFSVALANSARGEKASDGLFGTIKDSRLSIFLDGKDAGGGKWHQTLNGQAVSRTEMVFEGTHFDWVKDKWILTRTCSGKLRAVEPASARPPVVSGSVTADAPPAAPPTPAVPLPSVAARVPTSPVTKPVGPLPAAADAQPSPATVPKPLEANFAGRYSGPVTLSGLPSCARTIAPHLPVEIKNGRFDAVVFNVRLTAEVSANGTFTATGVRHSDGARAEVSGSIRGRTMELRMHNPYCKAYAILTAANAQSVAGENALDRKRRPARIAAGL